MNSSDKNPVVSSDESKVRGQAFRCLLDAVDELCGAETKSQVLAATPKELADAFRYGALVPSGWFPIAWYRDLHRAIRTAIPSQPDIHRRLGFLATKHDINGVYRFILQFTSPVFALSHVSKILGTYFSLHTFKITENRPQLIKAEVTIPGASHEIWLDVAGSCEAILLACGGHGGTVAMYPASAPSTAHLEATWTTAREASEQL